MTATSECKSGSTAEGIWRHDAEQLSHSMDWFNEKYDHRCSATPVLITTPPRYTKQASARPGSRVITFDHLAKLREAVRKYTAVLAADNDYRVVDKISTQLAAWGLNGKSFVQKWGVAPRKP